MRRQLIVVLSCLACLAAATAWTDCLETVARLPHVPHGGATAVAVSAGFAYYNSGPVLYAVDISTPADPQIVGEVTVAGDIAGITVNGSIAYVAMGSAGLCAIDISSPPAPQVGSCSDAVGASGDAAVAGGYLYLVGESAGLRVFDLKDPAHPVEVGGYKTPGRSWRVAVAGVGSGTYAFVADGQSGLRVVDVSTPSAPFEVAHVDAHGDNEFISDVAISDGYAFVADSADGLRVIDVSAPSSPVEAGRCDGCGAYTFGPISVVASGSTVYLGGIAVLAVDVSAPAAPDVVGHSGGWGFARDMAVADGYVFVAHQEAGLSIFRECDGSPGRFVSFIPAAVLAAGAQGAFFQTDVEINNTGDEDADVTFAWLPRGQDNPNALVSPSYVLAAGESRYFANALAEFFGLVPGATGALRLTSSSGSVIGMGRIYSIPPGGAGTVGQGVPAIPAGEMIGSGEHRRITFLCEDINQRANVSCVNATDRTIRVGISIHDASGTELGVRTMPLGPYANDQINRVLQPWQPVRGYVDVWSDTDGALFTCYGSVVDNQTNDPMTVLPQ